MEKPPNKVIFFGLLKERNCSGIIQFASDQKLENHADLQIFIESFHENDVHEFWNLIYAVIVDCFSVLAGKGVKEHVEMMPNFAIETLCTLAKIICSSFYFLKVAPLSFLNAVIHFNEFLPYVPSEEGGLKECISVLCTKYWLAGWPERESVIHNVILYLLNQTLYANKNKVKKDTIRKIWKLRETLDLVFNKSDTYKQQLVDVLELCVKSSDYLSIMEGRNLLSYILCLDASLVDGFHEKIKEKFATCTPKQSKIYGDIYFTSWTTSRGEGLNQLRESIEWVIQNIMEHNIYIPKYPGCILPQLKKFVSVFHGKKHDTHVMKLLCRLYSPILWNGLKFYHGLIRANAAYVFLDVFPLEDPDLKVVQAQNELFRRTLQLKDLLLDDCPDVRSIAAVGVSNIIAVHWALLPKDIISTYLAILAERLARDSTSPEVRIAVIKGMKILLDNHFEVHVLKKVLQKLSVLFHDKDEKVRIAFMRFLLDVKTKQSIQYWDLVSFDELLDSLKVETIYIRQLIVELISNSYIPLEQPEICWFQRSVGLIKKDLEASWNFFQFVPDVLDLKTTVKFIIFIFRALKLFAKAKTKCQDSIVGEDKEIDGTNDESIIVDDLVKLLEADGKPDVISGIIDAAQIMFQFSLSKLQEQENKKLYKSLISKIAKYMCTFLNYFSEEFEHTWIPLYKMCSDIPVSLLPEFPKLCFSKLMALPENDDIENYKTLMYCLCKIEKSSDLLHYIKNKLAVELQPSVTNSRTMKKSVRLDEVELKPLQSSWCLHLLTTEEDTSFTLLHENIEQLKDFLNLMDLVQENIVKSKTSLDSKRKDFLAQVFQSIVTIAIQLHQPNETTTKVIDVDGFLTKLMKWISSTFFIDSTLNSTQTRSSRRKMPHGVACQNASWQALGLSICQGFCQRLCYVMCLYVLDKPATDYILFIKQMMHSDYGSEMIQGIISVVLHLSKHCGLEGPSRRQQKENINLIFSIFPEIITMLRGEDFHRHCNAKDTIEALVRLLQSQKKIQHFENPIKTLMPMLLDGIMYGAVPVLENFDENKEVALPPPTLSLISAVLDDVEFVEPFLQSMIPYVSDKGLVECAATCVVLVKVFEETPAAARKLTTTLLALLHALETRASTLCLNSCHEKELVTLMKSSIAHVHKMLNVKKCPDTHTQDAEMCGTLK